MVDFPRPKVWAVCIVSLASPQINTFSIHVYSSVAHLASQEFLLGTTINIQGLDGVTKISKIFNKYSEGTQYFLKPL